MIRLLGVELTRLRWRRAVIMLTLAAIVIPAVIWATIAWDTRPVSADELAQAQQALELDRESNNYDREVRRCIRKPEEYGITADDPETECRQILEPQLEWYLYRPVLSLQEQVEGGSVGVLAVLGVLVLLAGATYAGADWNSGSMSNQLLFETRRWRVYTAKAVAVTVYGLVVGAAVFAAWWGALWWLAESRDLATSAAALAEVRGTILRGSLLAAGGALVGYALTMLFRSTVVTLGILFAVVVVGNIAVSLLPLEDNNRYLMPTNIIAVYADGTTYYAEPPEDCFDDQGMPGDDYDPLVCEGSRQLSMEAGIGYLSPFVVLSVVLAGFAFRRRDVP